MDKFPPGEAPIQNMYSFWYIKRNTGNKAVRTWYCCILLAKCGPPRMTQQQQDLTCADVASVR